MERNVNGDYEAKIELKSIKREKEEEDCEIISLTQLRSHNCKILFSINLYLFNNRYMHTYMLR